LVANLGSAFAMQEIAGGRQVIAVQMLIAAASLAACWWCMAAVRIREEEGKREAPGGEEAKGISSMKILRQDRRFRTYLVGMSFFMIGGLIYVSLIPAVLSKDFGYGYVLGALLLHVIPSLASFISTPWIGRHLDRAHPLKLWTALRFGWG